MAELNLVIKDLADNTWGNKSKIMLDKIKADSKRKYLLNDTEISDDTLTDTYVSIKAKNILKPRVVNRANQVIGLDDGVIYSGCYVTAKINIYAKASGDFGIWASLEGVQFVKDGEPFGGSKIASENDFEELEDEDLSSIL